MASSPDTGKFGSLADHEALRKRLIPQRRHAADTIPGIVAAYAALALIVGIVALGAAKMAFTNVRVETKTVQTTPKTANGLVTALGQPAQSIPGEQINENLKGATCAVYQPSDGLILICH